MAFTIVQLPGLTPTHSLLLLLAVTPILYFLYSVLYNLYLSPLAEFPGPKLWACSEFFYNRAVVSGIPHRKFLNFFEQYGPVVRITPTELIFSSAQAHRDVYGGTHAHRQLDGKKDYLAKDERVYNNFGLEEDHMISTLDTNVHARQRRMLATAFSDKSVREQEPMLIDHIDKLIASIEKYSVTECKDIDIKSWIDYTTFDITGYLVFGESFHCLDDAVLHPWVAFMTTSVRAVVLMSVSFKLPGMQTLWPYLLPKRVTAALEEHQALSLNRLEQRLAEGQTTEKADLVGLLLKNGITQDTERLIIAGSETSATLVTGALFFLLTHASAYARLVDEIRTTFSTTDSITALAASDLPYLHAVIHESLRMYPPSTSQFSRRTPRGGVIIDGYEVPGDTYVGVPHYAANRYSGNFRDANRWIPERWIDGSDRFQGDSREAMQPFGGGRHRCLGVK
ncbi:hypothetical protein PRZ48_013762 [Zasmidium cellare]|uniref:Cytochrome P450 n=1 Tax=Zasmidium cellare TaxID=395010 RepID=A0ABR0E2J6_ZASCE|nr:hypothetical protein PRZ48_013762 [Zasmidium cellare]